MTITSNGDSRYQELLRKVLTEGERHDNRTGVPTRSVFGGQLRLDLDEGFPLTTLRKLPFRWIVEELLWMLQGSTDALELHDDKDVRTWSPWLDQSAFGRAKGDLGPTYGHLIRRFGGIYLPTERVREIYDTMTDEEKGVDQLWKVCYQLDAEPDSRRIIVSQWDPVTVNSVEVPPCHPAWQLKVHGGPQMGQSREYLSMHVFQRSCDAAVGLAFDMAHYGLLLCLLAHYTCRVPKYLVFSFTDLHVYFNHEEAVAELLRREPRPLPRIAVDKELYHAVPGGPGQDTLINLLQTRYEHIRLLGYNPHPAMKFEVAK